MNYSGRGKSETERSLASTEISAEIPFTGVVVVVVKLVRKKERFPKTPGIVGVWDELIIDLSFIFWSLGL